MTTRTTPTSVQPTIRSAGPDDVEDIASTLAGAFQADPVFAWCIPDEVRRAQVLPASFELFTATVLPHGEVRTTSDGSAAGLWIPPGRPPVSEEQAPWFDECASEILGRDAGRFFDVAGMLDEHHPAAEHRFLWFLGVQPHRQGRGVGSHLLTDMLAVCDRDGVATYLDATSEDNRRLYERHGFEVVAERSVGGSPPLWPMWREPR
jgi:ribosomal protein S18 acetylase RimI-like enzyme